MDSVDLRPLLYYVNKMRNQYNTSNDKYPFRHLSLVFHHKRLI
jgi:hypothetical protein